MNDIISIAHEIDKRAVEFFKDIPQVVSIFVVGSMYDLEHYSVRQNNDYDIRLLVKKVTPEILEAVEYFQENTAAELEEEDVHLGCSSLVGAVNHHLSDKKYNLLIHFLVHEISDLKDFLPLTHQVQYGRRHRMLYGEDYLTDLARDFSPQYLISCHEGIDYCVDMLRRDVYKYLVWEEDDRHNVVFNYHEIPTPDEMLAESVFYSVKNVLNNLYESCVLMSGGARITPEEFYIRLCDGSFRFKNLVKCVVNRDEDGLARMGTKEEIFRTTVDFLGHLKREIEYMEERAS